MKELTGNIWTFHKEGNWITIPTNGIVRRDGACVMGRGLAQQVKNKFPALPYLIGIHINKYGNVIGLFEDYRIITLPVKHHWNEPADLDLIEESIRTLHNITQSDRKDIYLVRPGCGNGQLSWDKVKPILEYYLKEDKYIVVEIKR